MGSRRGRLVHRGVEVLVRRRERLRYGVVEVVERKRVRLKTHRCGGIG